jgi:hypothetical protein
MITLEGGASKEVVELLIDKGADVIRQYDRRGD